MNIHLKHSLGRTSGKRVAIVGAGACGLTAAKCLLEETHDITVFEQSAELGGLWNYHEELADGGGPAYRSLRTNTSKQIMAFSDFPFPDQLPDFPPRTDILQYLNDYANHFGLRERIRLNTTVVTVVPTAGGQWEVSYRFANGVTKEIFDAVVICSGLYRHPAIPQIPGSEFYQGTALHSVRYRGPDGYEGKDIVVVGVGSSGADIAVELSKVARQVMISTTRGAWFIPHYINNRPYDHQLTRLSALIPYRVRMVLFRRLILRAYRQMSINDPSDSWGFPVSEFDVWRARLTPDSEILSRIMSGAIVARPKITQLQRNHVVFADGNRAHADALVYCTGYTVTFPFLDDSIIQPAGDTVDLYKHVFHPNFSNLAFIGYCIVGGPLLPVAELQARWVGRVFAGAGRLPSSMQMWEEVRRRRALCTQKGAHLMRVQLLDYMDDVARTIGVQPKLRRHPKLILRLLLGPLTAAQYRLEGPGKWNSAEAVIRALNSSRASTSVRA